MADRGVIEEARDAIRCRDRAARRARRRALECRPGRRTSEGPGGGDGPRVLGAGLALPRCRELSRAVCPRPATLPASRWSAIDCRRASGRRRFAGALLAGRLLELSVGAAVLPVLHVGAGPVVARRALDRGALPAGLVRGRVLPAVL